MNHGHHHSHDVPFEPLGAGAAAGGVIVTPGRDGAEVHEEFQHLGLDAGHGTVAEAEHWLDDVLAATGLDLVDGVVACTHLVRVPWPHVAVSLAVPVLPDGLPAVPDPLAGAAEEARAAHAAGRSGRASHFPGRDRLTGILTVADLIAASSIDAVVVLGAPPPPPDTLVETRDFVRPRWMDGRLTLVTAPAPDGRLTPFEVPNPTPCCAETAGGVCAEPSDRAYSG